MGRQQGFKARIATEVVYTDEFGGWFGSLSEGEQDRVYRSVGLLEACGVALGFPHSSAIQGASFALRELRTQAAGDPLRTLYAFDPSRNAVLLIGGDKTGDDRFYERLIPSAERIWKGYLEQTGQTKAQKK
jgi:hypothetical protein